MERDKDRRDVAAPRVTRWRRYGKDRLYVTAGDGDRLGWQDMLTGERHVQHAGRVDELHRALDGYSAGMPAASEPAASVPAASVPAPAQSPTTRPPTSRPARTPPWPVTAGTAADGAQAPAPAAVVPGTVPADDHPEDLADRRPGAAAREQALALHRAAPIRAVLARVLGVHTSERAWRVGADGEEKVAAQLARLCRKDSRWRVLHAVPVGERGSDIDHMVIGPGGVYTMNAKHHPGARIWVGGASFLVNGRRRPYLRNSRHEAERAGRLLSAACGFPVTATGVVVPVGAAEITIATAPDGVNVVNRLRLRRWLRDRPASLDQPAVEAVHAAARRADTWRPAAGGTARRS